MFYINYINKEIHCKYLFSFVAFYFRLINNREESNRIRKFIYLFKTDIYQ